MNARVSRTEPEPWGVDEIAAALNVKRATVYYHVNSGKKKGRNGFPAPWAELAMGRVWRSTDVLEWRRLQQNEGVTDERTTG